MRVGVSRMGRRGGRSLALSPAGAGRAEGPGALETWREATLSGRGGQGWEGRPSQVDAWANTSKKAAMSFSFQVNEGERGGNALCVDS